MRTISSSQYRLKLIALRLCPACLEPLEGGETLCMRCRQLAREGGRRLRERRRSEGKCVRCGKLAVPGQLRCERCQTREVQDYRAKSAQLAAENRCARCREFLPPGHLRRQCDGCLDKSRQAVRASRRKRSDPKEDIIDDFSGDTPERIALRKAALKKLGIG